jgi:GNAT superfamily N-acetyltransferase
MRELQIIAEPYPPQAWSETVIRGVDQHNIAVTGLPDYYPVGFFVKGRGGEVIGGLLGEIWGGWLHVGSLWVSEALRGRGYGSELMARAHQYALEKSCSHAFLQTGSYEARPLYEGLGYNVYAELKNHPTRPHSRYFLFKRLNKDDEGPLHVKDKAIVMDPYPSKDAEMVVRQGISTHAYAAIGLPEREWAPHNFFLRDGEGEILGGALGNIWGDWMYLAYLWVDRSMRGNGHATRMMQAAEEHAIAKGCGNAFLGTFSFQARPLYEKLGYQVVGEEKDYPKGHSHYLMTKRIGTEARQNTKTPREDHGTKA